MACDIACLPGPVVEVAAGFPSVWVLKADYPLGPGRVPRFPRELGKIAASFQGVWMLATQHPLDHRHQPGELIPGARRVPCSCGPPGQIAAGFQARWREDSRMATSK
jgi:hypothetical protein